MGPFAGERRWRRWRDNILAYQHFDGVRTIPTQCAEMVGKNVDVWTGAGAGPSAAYLEREQYIEDELGGLGDETTEIGIIAEDAFKNASAALYGEEPDAAWIAIENERVAAQRFQALHQKALALLGRHIPSGETMRRVIELQQVAAEFARIAEDAKSIAEQALALGGTGEAQLLRAGGDAPILFVQIVRQAYVQVRGCVIATTTRDTALARRLLHEDDELDRLFLEYKSVLNAAILSNARAAATLGRLVLVGVHFEDIGNRVVAICRALLFAAPPPPSA